jgi:high affinity sulfate transporter 1
MASLTPEKPKRDLKSFLPILDWLPKYDKSWIRWDVIAALTVWALLVPEAMAYAGIAGMPPQTGLYTAPLALIGYAIFGTSRHLNVGPSSTVAILSFAIIGGIAVAGGAEFIALTTGLALLTGVLLILAGLLKLGVMADFLSKPVLGGFIIGLAITIAFGQVDKLLGYSVEADGFFREVIQFFVQFGQVHVPTLIVGGVSLAALFLLHRYVPRLPAAITVLILAIALSALLKLHDNYGIHIVGEIPAGLPPFGIPDVSLSQYLQLIPGAVAVALVGFAESVAAARSYATKFGYRVDANQEMVGLGIANLGAGVSGGFVVDGSLSKTAASVGAGAKTQMTSIIAAIFVLITVLFLTPLFYHLPEATLGAIVIHAVWKLITFRKLRHYYAIRKADFWAALVALLGVLVFGLLGGLFLAVLLSLVALLATVKNPHAAILGKLPGSNAYRSLENFPEAETYPGLLIFRFDSLLFFANAPNFSDLVEAALKQSPDAKVLLIDAEPINYVDVTAIDMLNELYDTLQEKDVELWFSGIISRVYDTLERGGLVEKIGAERFYPSLHSGVDAYLAVHPAPDYN